MIPERVIDLIGDAVRRGTTRRAAAHLVGVHPSVLGEWLTRGEEDVLAERETSEAELYRVVLAGEAEHEQTLTSAWTAKAGGDWRAAQALLERRHRDGWEPPKQSQRTELELGGTVASRTETVLDLSGLSLDQLRALAYPPEEK